MNKPADYDSAAVYGDTPKLPAGGYVCRIMSVEETRARSGADMLKISLDIFEGEYKGFYAARYRADNRPNKKWSCVVNQLVYDPKNPNSTNPGFKTFNTCVVNSNNGFEIQWGANYAAAFKDKLVGVLFGREQFLGTDNQPHWSTKPMQFRSVETIHSGNYELPKDKPLSAGSRQSGYPPAAPASAGNNGVFNPDDFEDIIADGDLPF